MNREIIVKKFKKQIAALGLLRFMNGKDQKFVQWVIITKLYLLGIFPDKKDEYIRDSYIKLFDDAVAQMPDKKKSGDEAEDLALSVRLAKNNIQSVLKAFIEVLEIQEEVIRPGKGSSKISIENKQSNNQKVNTQQIVKNIISEIGKVTKDPDVLKTGIEKTQEFEEELKKKNSNWGVIKDVTKWFADAGKEVFIAAIPALLDHYKNT